MATLYFCKYVPQIPVLFAGVPVPFEPLVNGVGVIALEDSPKNDMLIQLLQGLSQREKLGVKQLVQSEYEDLKKNPPNLQRNRQQSDALKPFRPQAVLSGPPNPPRKAEGVAAPAAAKPPESKPVAQASMPTPQKRTMGGVRVAPSPADGRPQAKLPHTDVAGKNTWRPTPVAAEPKSSE